MIVIRKEVIAPSSVFRGAKILLHPWLGPNSALLLCHSPWQGLGGPARPMLPTLMLTYHLLVAGQTGNRIPDPCRGEVR